MLNPLKRFAWNKEALAIVLFLSRKEFSAGEIAAVLGTTRNSVVGKVYRTPGIELVGKSGGTQDRNKLCPERIAQAQRLIGDGVDPSILESLPSLKPSPGDVDYEVKPKNPPARRAPAKRIPKRRGQPLVAKPPQTIEPPLDKEELEMILAPEAATPDAVQFKDLKANHCRWVIDDVISGENTWCCGKKTHEMSSYCLEHRLRATTPSHRKLLQERLGINLGQKELTKVMGSSRRRRSLGDTENSNSSRKPRSSKTSKDKSESNSL